MIWRVMASQEYETIAATMSATIAMKAAGLLVTAHLLSGRLIAIRLALNGWRLLCMLGRMMSLMGAIIDIALIG